MDAQELVPLEAGTYNPELRLPPLRQTSHQRCRTRSCYQAPMKVCRLMMFLILLPSLFIFVPLYMRYRVFSSQIYPMGMTDMRLIDGKISPTWCQRQVVKSNTTFNAFLVPGAPELSNELVPVSMTRQLVLEDDMKEYWGFYLLEGSTVTVSTCVRWPGASLIMIKGYKHLQDCAYIGDDSSEELDELVEAYDLGLIPENIFQEKRNNMLKPEGKPNNPGTMKRHKSGVSFHDPIHKPNDTGQGEDVELPDEILDLTDHDPKELRAILDHIHAIRQAAKDKAAKFYRPPAHLISLPGLHRHRDTNVDKGERQYLSFKDIDGNSTEKDFSGLNLIAAMTQKNNNTIHTTTTETTVDNQFNNLLKNKNRNSTVVNKSVNVTNYENKDTQEEIKNINSLTEKEFGATDKKYSIKIDYENKEVEDKENNKTEKIESNEESSETISSKEVFEDVLKKLQSLGDRGARVLLRLHSSMGLSNKTEGNVKVNKDLGDKKKEIMSKLTGSDDELDHLRQVLVEAIDEEKTRNERRQKRHEANEQARKKRQLMIGAAPQKGFAELLNEDDEARNLAAEELDYKPDGFAEHHTKINESTPFDMSNSEFWSSFSSSEEALLECDGLILNLPLTPHSMCQKELSEESRLQAAQRNAVTYRVPANGYYFFVFNSENEVQKNFINVRFDLQKTRYEVARTTLRECRNSTERCDLALDIFSSQKVVLELPLRENDSLWNEQFVVISECEPRTSIYLTCVIAVPLIVIMFAFQ